jgi:ABC-2 type transport system permease protein
MQHVMKATPTYWLREIGQSAFTGGAQVGTAMLVLAGYAVVAGVIVARRYAADTVRV